jgi:RNA recognition motif-containing protein
MGVAYINFKDTESAISCFAGLDQKYFQGRKIHILPAEKKPPSEPKPEFEFKKFNKEN